jgi:site-specific recombinase XerD
MSSTAGYQFSILDHSGRTPDACRHDVRNLFQWAADHDLAVLEAMRAHLEMYGASMAKPGLATSTIDRRLPAACGCLSS